MRIGDWSSDVCSSDLLSVGVSAAMQILPPLSEQVSVDVARALAEDLGSGDVTAALLPDIAASAYLLSKEDAVVCGRPWFDACHRAQIGRASCRQRVCPDVEILVVAGQLKKNKN